MELLMLLPSINTSSSWKPMIIIYPLVMVMAGIWIYVDASSRTGNACSWASLAFAVPPIGVPLYYISLLIVGFQASRGPDKVEREERERMEAKRKQYVMQGLVEREKDFEQAMQGGGTMFDAASGMGKQLDGFKYYTDHRAEELIDAQDFTAARLYLEEMLGLARQDNDTERIETCRFYLNQLPDRK